jgi:hypothetical protein
MPSSFGRPQDGHAFVNIFHFFGRLGHATRSLCTPNVQQENNTGRKSGKLEMRRGIMWGTAALQIHHVCA